MALIFYKILLDPSAPHLELPPDFVTKNKIPTGPIILCANGGYSWRLKIKQIGDGYCFADGWNNVVEEVPLDFGDFLYFRLVDQSHFKMSLYSPEGCEMFLPPKVENEDNEEEKDDDDDPFFTLVITKTNMNILRFPREFVGLAGIDDAEETMTLKNVDGKEWLSCLRVDNWNKNKRYYLSTGWRDFRRANNLSEGDKCVFKFIISEGKLLLAKVVKKN